MALIALAGLLLFLAVAFGWRTWRHYRETGDAGVRPSSRSLASRLAWLVMLAGGVAVLVAPVLDLLGAASPITTLENPFLQGAGIAGFVLGFALTVRAQHDMGTSWRIGVDAAERTALITSGVFRHVRNPVFSGMILVFGGVALMVPNALALIGGGLFLIGIELQVRMIEEPYLARLHAGEYRSYASRTGRFVPGLGRTHSP